MKYSLVRLRKFILSSLFLWAAIAFTASNVFADVAAIPRQAAITINTTDDELNNDGDCSLREAIEAANTNAAVDACPAGEPGPTMDEINIPAGTYGLATELVITDPVHLRGNSLSDTFIEATGSNRLIDYSGAGPLNLTIQFLTLRNGDAGVGEGGAIQMVNSTGGATGGGSLLLITSSLLDNNSATNGGAIAARDVGVEVSSSQIANNNAELGGAILAEGNGTSAWTVDIIDSFINNNTSVSRGGGIWGFASTLYLENAVIANNSSIRGGGIYMDSGSSFFPNGSQLSGNSATEFGGAVYVENQNQLQASHTTFSGNTATLGAAAISAGVNGAFDLFYVTIANNTVTTNGGTNSAGISLSLGPVTATLANIRYSVIADNDFAGTPSDCHINPARAIDLTYSFIGANGSCNALVNDGNSSVGTSAAPLDPQLGPLALNGNTEGTFTHEPLAASPLVDAIPSGTTGAACSGIATDQDTRLRPQGPACDIGAHERAVAVGPATITVNTTEDELITDGDCSLQEAVAAANTNAAVDACTAGSAGLDNIVIPPGNYMLLSELEITEALALDGQSTLAEDIVIQPVPGSSAFSFLRYQQDDIDLSISNMTFQNAVDAPAVLVLDSPNGVDGTATFTNTLFQGNTGNFQGAAIAGTNVKVVVQDSTFKNNEAANGPAIRILPGAGGTYGAIDIENSVFEDNIATSSVAGGGGGAVFAGVDVDVVVRPQSVFKNNTTPRDGGAIYSESGNLEISGATLVDNNANLNGGAIYANNSADVTIANVIITGNEVNQAGGGVYVSNASGLVSIDKAEISQNTASGGAGVWSDSDIWITDTTISSNTSFGTGGGITQFENDLNLIFSTVVNNVANGADAGLYIVNGVGYTSQIVSSVIADNTIGGTTPDDCSVDNGPAIINTSYSFIGADNCGVTDGGNNNINTGDSAALGPLQVNPVTGFTISTRTHLPSGNSPLVDAIPTGSAECPAAFGTRTDQRGIERWQAPTANNCDIGAHEVHPDEFVITGPATITVNTTAGAGADGLCSLDEAIQAANTNAAVDACNAGGTGTDDIVLPADADFVLAGTLTSINSAIQITGNGATIRRDTGAGAFNLFTNNSSLTITNAILADGEDPSGAAITSLAGSVTLNGGTIIENNVGVAVYGDDTTLTVEDVIIRNNDGVGIYSESGSSATLNDVQITGNTGRGIFSDAIVTITGDSSISNNLGGGIQGSTVVIQGADILIDGNGGPTQDISGAGVRGTDITIEGATISNNVSNTGSGSTTVGGGVSTPDGGATQVTLTDVKITGNTARNGGGVYVSRADLTITNSLISNNTAAFVSTTTGGGVRFFSDSAADNLSITGTEISYNSVEGGSDNKGGGIYLRSTDIGTTFDIANSTISNNSMTSNTAQGAGIYLFDSGNLTLDYTTVASNQAGSNSATLANGGGFYNDIGFGQGNIEIKGSVFANNFANGQPDDCSGAAVPGRGGIWATNSFIGVNDDCPIGVSDGSTIGSVAAPENAQLGPLQVNPLSGLTVTTRTHMPIAGSPLINRVPTGPDCVNGDLDQRGATRPQDPTVSDNAICDIGAHEVFLEEFEPNNIAWTNALPIPLNGTGGAVTGQPTQGTVIKQDGESRWFRFEIQPGSQVAVTLSGLPADYDMVVYRDISQTYSSLNDPEDAIKLQAEFAPDLFSPDLFSPDLFSPDLFSPDLFSPDLFSPDLFSPDLFSPDLFSPDLFSPDLFSPDLFSPDLFSPDLFSPDLFSPDLFSPDLFSPDLFSQDFAAAQIAAIAGANPRDGLANEEVTLNTWDNAGEYYVRIRGRDGAFDATDSFTLNVSVFSENCSDFVPTTTATSLVATANGYQTVIVYDSARMSVDVDGNPTVDLTDMIDHLNQLALATNGVVIDVNQDARVVAAHTAADAVAQCAYGRNLAADSIKTIIDAYRDTNPIEHVVLIGNDDVMPFYRVADQALLANESNYVPPVDDASASQAVLRSGYFLSQDHYGASETLNIKGVILPLQDLPVGRLVETPENVITVIDAFLEGGTTDVAGSPQRLVPAPTNAFVTGYDFLDDAAEAVFSELSQGLGDPANVTSVITPGTVAPSDVNPTGGRFDEDPNNIKSWTADDLRTDLFSQDWDMVYLAGHFSAFSALAADYETRFLATELAASPVDWTNTLVFSTGCHSGYNTVDAHGVLGVTQEPDWAEAFAAEGATLIAGTGYQYGDSDFIEYNERLYELFSRQLRTGNPGDAIAYGDALMEAKGLYLAETVELTPLHLKSVLEVTLYGLPMLSVDMPSGRADVPEPASLVDTTTPATSNPGATLGLETDDIDFTLASTQQTVVADSTDDNNVGTTFALTYFDGREGVVAEPYRPVAPLQIENVSFGNQVLRGVGWRGGTYTDVIGVTPLTGAPTTELRSVHVPFEASEFFPILPWNVNYVDALDGGLTRLMTLGTQFRSDDDLNTTTGTMRQINSLNMRMFYNNNTDLTDPNIYASLPALAGPPSIGDVVSDAVANTDGSHSVSVMTRVLGDPSAGIHEVWLLWYEEGGNTWTPVDFIQSPNDSRNWGGQFTLPAGINPDNVRFMLQAANGVGLVTADTNLGAWYPLVAPPPAVPMASTSISIPNIAGNVEYGTEITASVQLVDEMGIGLPNQLIEFVFGPVSQYGVTDGGGTATVQQLMLGVPGQYDFVASYAGDDTYLPSQNGLQFNIVKQPTTFAVPPVANLTIDDVDAADPETSVWGAALEDSEGQRLREKTVIFVVTDADGIAYSESVITNNNGQAELETLSLPVGTYTITVYYGTPVPTLSGDVLDLTDDVYGGTTATIPLTITILDNDGDGVANGDDNCVNTANSDQANLDGDDFGDACDPDDDGDTFDDDLELRCGSNPLDGTIIPTNTDNPTYLPDGDPDNFITDANGTQIAGDLIPDCDDDDDDNDGTLDVDDAFPEDVNEQIDTDEDGTGNNADTDDDDDGQTDAHEIACGSNPLDVNSLSPDADGNNIPDCVDDLLDNDNDTIPNGVDNCPNVANDLQEDLDLDGQGDACDADIDGDGFDNGDDWAPTDPAEWADADGDELGDNADLDDDNDGIEDTVELDENCGPTDPLDASSRPLNTDNATYLADDDPNNFVLNYLDEQIFGDFIPDCVDEDDDNDGTLDGEDAFPLDLNEQVDTDGDDIGNNADLDDDDDGISDEEEGRCGSEPLDAGSVPGDLDNDTIFDCDDDDIDGDNVLNDADACPADPLGTVDTDGDMVCNYEDEDDDGDSVSDVDETNPACNTNPLDATSVPLNTDNETYEIDVDGNPTVGDLVPNCLDDDDDDDGVLDVDDVFPTDPNEDTDTDGDGTGDNSDPDIDGDGQSNEDELTCGSDPYLASDKSPDANNDGIPDCITNLNPNMVRRGDHNHMLITLPNGNVLNVRSGGNSIALLDLYSLTGRRNGVEDGNIELAALEANLTNKVHLYMHSAGEAFEVSAGDANNELILLANGDVLAINSKSNAEFKKYDLYSLTDRNSGADDQIIDIAALNANVGNSQNNVFRFTHSGGEAFSISYGDANHMLIQLASGDVLVINTNNKGKFTSYDKYDLDGIRRGAKDGVIDVAALVANVSQSKGNVYRIIDSRGDTFTMTHSDRNNMVVRLTNGDALLLHTGQNQAFHRFDRYGLTGITAGTIDGVIDIAELEANVGVEVPQQGRGRRHNSHRPIDIFRVINSSGAPFSISSGDRTDITITLDNGDVLFVGAQNRQQLDRYDEYSTAGTSGGANDGVIDVAALEANVGNSHRNIYRFVNSSGQAFIGTVGDANNYLLSVGNGTVLTIQTNNRQLLHKYDKYSLTDRNSGVVDGVIDIPTLEANLGSPKRVVYRFVN